MAWLVLLSRTVPPTTAGWPADLAASGQTWLVRQARADGASVRLLPASVSAQVRKADATGALAA
jgi:hypothetical protein